MGDLLDVNVWVALSVIDHPFHARALHYWQNEAAESLIFCRTTALGLVRVCTIKTTMGGVPLSPAKAWGTYRGWRNHSGVVLIEEPGLLEATLEGWIEEGIVTPRTWTDAY